MDYDALANIIAVPARSWGEQQVFKWLKFIHLEGFFTAFSSNHITGQKLLNLDTITLKNIGIQSAIIQRKLIRWIHEGLPEFQAHLKTCQIDNKENIPPLQRKNTTNKQQLKNKAQKISFIPEDDESMIIRNCDGNLAAFYIMKEKSLKIGRSQINTIRSLEISVESEHSQIFRIGKKHYLRDNGTEAGTFIKILNPIPLSLGTLIEMGSFLLQTQKIDYDNKMLSVLVTHMITKGTCQIIISLQDGCSFYNFGRRKTCNFSFDDEHLSGIHARIFILHNQFVIEDLHSTNGTWLRLSHPNQPSVSYPLEEGSIFKVGTTITYQCQKKKSNEQKMDIQYDDTCISCMQQKKNILLLPCRHNIVCSSCASPIYNCPTCGSTIQQKIKIYI